MSKLATKEQWRTLRRYALSGEMSRARRLLQIMVEEHPEDREAAAELARLEAGKPLHVTETSKERQKRLCTEAAEALYRAIQRYTPRKLVSMPTKELQDLRSQIRLHTATLKNARSAAPQGTNDLQKALRRELSRRRKKTTRTLMITLGSILLTLLALGGTLFLLHRRAQNLAAQLEEAFRAADWEKTESRLKATDTGINNLVYPKLGELVSRVHKWQQSVHARAQELGRIIVMYENLEAISTLSLEERANFIRRIHALPHAFADKLLTQWKEICRPDQERLDKQRDDIVAEVAAPVSPPSLTGQAQEDARELRRTRQRLQQLISTFRDAKDAFGLDPLLISPNEVTLAKVEAYLADVEQLLKMELRLGAARSYDQHLLAMSEIFPKHYKTALSARELHLRLPSEESIRSEVRAMRHKVPRQLDPTVVQAILQKGPSFSPSHPATNQQVHLMEDIFTTRTLRQKIYEITRASGETRYSDAYPEISDKNKVVFNISPLDPTYSIDKPARVEWEDPHSVWTRLIDTTPLLRSTGITRERFFLTANLPELLGKITDIQDKNCPALAKAYLYHTLSELMRQHTKPDILGLRYSTTLQEDIKSFRQLMARSRLQLTPTCWLRRSGDTLAAEAMFAQWFAEHAHRDYAGEMRKNFAPILRNLVHYAGYVNAQGQTCFREPPAAGGKLWYISEGKLVTSPIGEELKNPTPFSPLFIEP